MEQFFNIQMIVPLGRRIGTLSLKKSGEQDIYGTLNLFGYETPFNGKLMPGGEIAFSGQMITLTRTFPYQAQGRIDGTKIKLEVVGDNSRFIITGEEDDLCNEKDYLPSDSFL